MTNFPIAALILALAVTANPVVKIGNLESLTPAKISGQVYMNDENTIVIKDFKIEIGLAGQRVGYFLAGISDSPPVEIDFYQRRFKNYRNADWTDIDDESTLLHYSLDGISFQYNDASSSLISGSSGFYRNELT